MFALHKFNVIIVGALPWHSPLTTRGEPIHGWASINIEQKALKHLSLIVFSYPNA